MKQINCKPHGSVSTVDAITQEYARRIYTDELKDSPRLASCLLSCSHPKVLTRFQGAERIRTLNP